MPLLSFGAATGAIHHLHSKDMLLKDNKHDDLYTIVGILALHASKGSKSIQSLL